jgi:hypothetical protein
MTEAEWLACDEPTPMIRWLRDRVSDRKFRWFAIACCRRIWDRLKDSRSRAAVDFAERHAEFGVARRRGRPVVDRAARAACQEAEQAEVATLRRTQDRVENGLCLIDVNASRAARATLEGSAWLSAEWAAGASANVAGWVWLVALRGELPLAWDGVAARAEATIQARLLRGVFGNPSRPASIDAAWLRWNDGVVLKIAQGIYDEHAFNRLPILGDALLDAGCDDEDILAHCRSKGPHIRGCWVIDLILGKE